MKNDTASPLASVRATSSESLSSRIVNTRAKAEFEHQKQKASMRRCIQVSPSASRDPVTNDARPIELQHHDSDEYIAISCPWYLPGHDTVSGRYVFVPEQPPGVIMPPDIVLDRILNFKACNPEYAQTPFWIDKMCIDQVDSGEKEIAVHSMDLVYQYSGRLVPASEPGQAPYSIGCSLGLLFTRIDTAEEVILLRKLLDSKFSEYVDDEQKLLLPAQEADAVLDIVEKILQDNWWHRAWIFQEEFLASKYMKLLLPCNVDRAGLYEKTEDGLDLFGNTIGEIHVHALNFRTEVTTFCLALGRLTDRADQKDRCSEILKYARRYTFLHRSKFTVGPSSVVGAMSPAIFEDIGSRGITVPTDILAIAANCCRYVRRLSSKALESDGADGSLSVAILTLFLLNGEILRHDVRSGDILEQNVFECLRKAKLPIDAPTQAGALIFIKTCRLPFVNLTHEGAQVRGVLSRLDRKVKVNISDAERREYWKTDDGSNLKMLTEAEKNLVRALAKHLEGLRQFGGDAMPGLLRQFTSSHTAKGQFQYWGVQHMQLLMAKAVCRAMAEGRPLWTARVHVPGTWTPWLGVFVLPEELIGGRDIAISFAFTASGSDNEFRDRGATLARKNARFTSLEVGLKHGTQEITPKKWLNGLTFFNNTYHLRDQVIPWPEWMK